ncbi:hypothetical protein GUITHDRAFT_100235 [Guillardia theta CCMP2712]|uniref:Cilia- and flagella-associated protein 43 n=1 Tax=Guillardia theta (strain CCMP2712) TaxID=905079 RepID=L1K097_GUITC|nr:hypothetical protein GUITHDRAFT_100235 [Guillardia theta CCMP2712]EKX53984.1 hypothetical protein GUITHDRAFT_100235 [Guillardia theta CCMP2712]|eukprot:XP_005840964.1 hypothetical protein GUITHDRAFT_100235 [Guillardia theta CCMP2712]
MRAFASMPVLCVVGSRGLFSVWLAPAMRLLSSVRFDCNLSIVALSEEAKVAALGSEDGQVMVLDMSDVKAPRTVFSCPAHSSRVLGLSFPSPSLLLSASSDGSVVFFSISRGSVSLLRRLQMEEVLSVDMYQQTHLFVSTKSRRLFILPVPEHGEEEQEQEAVTRGGQEEQEGAVLPAAMISFKVIASSQPNAGRLVGWLADRSLRSFTFTLLPLSLREMSSCKDFSSPGTSLAVSEDGEVLLAGGADGRLYLKTLASLEGGLQRSRHRRLLWRLPSGRGAGRERGERKAGVSCLELGNGAMRGWFFSGGHDSAIIAQPLNSRSSKPLDFVPSSSPGLLALLPSLEENDAQEGEEAAAEGAGSADPVLEKRKSSIRRRRAEEGGVIREQLEDLKEKFDMILSNNRTCPEEERLNRTDIIVDVKERQRLLDMADAMVANVRQEISRVNDAKEEEALQIKSLCFDAMEVTQLVVVPLGKGSERLYSFPLKKQTEEELKAFERVTMMRKIEMRENELRVGMLAMMMMMMMMTMTMTMNGRFEV